jgi:GH25 family lysozyme M1 (1,4-beta-N-acetylmuramidase)
MARTRGIDVSHWQIPGSQQIADVISRLAVMFAWIKVSQGASGRDVRAAAHHRWLGQLRLKRGAYHFADTRWTAEANAANFLAAMGGLSWELRPALDLEQNRGGLGPDALAAWAQRFCELVEQSTGVRPMIYTYASWWNATVAALASLTRYLLWVARYPNAYLNGSVPDDQTWTGPAHPWTRAIVWQFSSAANLDRNLVESTDFAAIQSGTVPPTPTPGDGTMSDADVQAIKADLATIHQQVQTLLDTGAKKAVALRSKKDGKVWIVSDEGRWHVPDMETLNVLIFVGQVHGFGTDGVAEVDESVLDGIPVLDAPK